MGAQLVAATYQYWGHLPDRPFRLLAAMALSCLDDAKVPTYYGGRTAQARTLGLPDNNTGHKAVKRAVAALVAAGAVERTLSGYSGKRSEYALNVRKPPVDNSVPATTKGGHSRTPIGGQPCTPIGGHSRTPSGGTPLTPLGTTEEQGARNTGGENQSSTEGEYRLRVVARAREQRISPIDQLTAERNGLPV